MKICMSLITALCLVHPTMAFHSTAFAGSKHQQRVVLHADASEAGEQAQTTPLESPAGFGTSPVVDPASAPLAVPSAPKFSQRESQAPMSPYLKNDYQSMGKIAAATEFQEEGAGGIQFDGMFPIFPTVETIQGGGTIKTYKMPKWADRCQYMIKTDGRPLAGKIELWLGPQRRTHQLEFFADDGAETPYQATLKFKKEAQTLRIASSSSLELPVQCAVYVPSPERGDELHEYTESLWDSAIPEAEKKLVQGGDTRGGGGAIRTWNIPSYVESVQLLVWSKDVSKKSFRTRIAVLQGPNNIKQKFMLQCGGGSQPYHGIIQTPGAGSVIWATNLKFVEDGLTQIAIIPYKINEEEKAYHDAMLAKTPAKKTDTGASTWWERK